MTTPFLVDDLKRDEGLRLTAYKDTGGVWTIGYGHTGRDVTEGLTWTQSQADTQLAMDVGAAIRALDAEIPWWRSLNDVRQDVLAEMAFNMGVRNLLQFKHTLEAIQGGVFGLASAGMLGSKWASQVGERAQRLADMMESGVRA